MNILDEIRLIPPDSKIRPKGRHPGGRPPKYAEELARKAAMILALNNLTVGELCRFLKVSKKTFERWQGERPYFRDLVRLARQYRKEYPELFPSRPFKRPNRIKRDVTTTGNSHPTKFSPSAKVGAGVYATAAANNVCPATARRWMARHPDFRQAVLQERSTADLEKMETRIIRYVYGANADRVLRIKEIGKRLDDLGQRVRKDEKSLA